MKIKINIFKVILASLAVATFFSCENPVALGTKLDIDGPIITITSPLQRQSVPVEFDMEGTARDYTGVDKMIIKAVINNTDFQRQWRYQKNVWEFSDDYGETWSPLKNAVWDGNNNSASWKVPIDMKVSSSVMEGEYTFNVQAWDKGGFTDDNSFKAIVLIIDFDPPKVLITNPYLYSKYAYDTDVYFQELDAIVDESPKWKDPAYLGKFITQEFSLKWQIEDSNDVWSININFYPHDVVIDNDPDTPLPDNYIYRYHKNTPKPPPGANPNDYVKLNGSVTVPDLYSQAGIYEGGGELKNPIPLKTTVKVVAVCYDAAGNPNQEKTLGFFISWPKANSPWIDFTDGLEGPDDFYGKSLDVIEGDVFTVYPGRSIKATAFQSHGVKEVKYTLYECNTSGNILNGPDSFKVKELNKVVSNTSYGGTYSTIFPWELNVPPFTGYYVFEAEAFTSQGIPSEKYTMLFRVHDITFPDFTEGPFPVATDPLFMAMAGNKITISGTVSDATDIVSLCMVWINPNSKGYAAMSQLSYFRNTSYAGWRDILRDAPGVTRKEDINFDNADYPWDKIAPNRLWNLILEPNGIDYETNRHLFKYEQIIDITEDLGIGPDSGQTNLKSQIFLLRAQNPDGKCTVITYAPQGDTLAPSISISKVDILKKGNPSPVTYYPNTYSGAIEQFSDGDTITINGEWSEDSVSHLDIDKYFLKNIEITVNNQILPKLTKEINIITWPTDHTPGTWTIKAEIGKDISKDKLKDTLVIGVKARDIGGNEAEAGSSWLIQSDNLRLMRISSEDEDKIYKAGEKIKIFLEFSKPVKITYSVGAEKPALILSSNSGDAAIAEYVAGQVNFNSRQYFEYTVQSGHATGTGVNEYLNVKGLHFGSAYTESTPYYTGTYPFTWSRGTQGTTDYEEVRITMAPNNKGDEKPLGYFVRTLPTTTSTSNADYQFTLAAGKHIKIDTTPPTVTSIAASTIPGHYKSGDIYITVTFSKDVTTGDALPQLILDVTGGGDSKTNTDNIKVNGKTITFMYRIKTNDTTNGSPVRVTGVNGDIIDLARNGLTGGISGTLAGLYIDTIPMTIPPIIRVLDADTSNQIGISGGADVDLKNIYNNSLKFAVLRGDPSDGAHRLDKFEYSVNGGTSWLTADNINNTPFDKPSSMANGTYSVIARQINKAGNVSPPSNAVKFIWDKGNIISRISSTSANGTYTNTQGSGGSRQDTINITVTFRKKIKFDALPSITINSTSTPVTAAYTLGTATEELTFNYLVGANDKTPTGQYLDVTSFNISGINVQDEAGINVNNFLAFPSAGFLLKDLKKIEVKTGALSVSGSPVFDNSKITGGGIASDGSYNTALVITFDRKIVKGAGYITIIQDTADYRLPAVLTESQFSKYNNITNVNKFYTRGSNGYIYNNASDRKVDTSTKYILDYNVDTADAANAPGVGSERKVLAEDFRQAEKIYLSINANAVKVSGNQLIVELKDTNALQVPGTNYFVYYDKGFVQDELSTPCPEVTVSSPSSVSIGGVAKPFIRINKTQDTISVNTNVTNTNPARLLAVQPFQANVRMDCRTPGSTIYYFTTNEVTNTTAMNWTINANPDLGGPGDLNNPAPEQPSDPQTTTAARQTYSSPITIGTANDYQGLQWYVRAKANKGAENAAANWSVNSEEMAFKTVITYQITNMNTNQEIVETGIRPANNDQLWIRGGDGIGLSSVPGFPINWEDDFDVLKTEKKRAGIRLFTNDTTTTNIYTSSRWRFITWEINVDTYFDIILGRDTTSTAAEALQYGPRQFAYQRAGWTSFKNQYRALPGKHRWLVSNNPTGTPTKGTTNFSGTFSARPQYTGDDITFTP